jgi:hypothetical protein
VQRAKPARLHAILKGSGSVSGRNELELNGYRLVLVDSITEAGPQDAGAIVISGSHGGVSAAYYAAKAAALVHVFNDAGIGVDEAGVAGLQILDDAGIAGITVSNESARIGDAADSLKRGVVSRVNGPAGVLGFRPGEALRSALERLFQLSV